MGGRVIVPFGPVVTNQTVSPYQLHPPGSASARTAVVDSAAGQNTMMKGTTTVEHHAAVNATVGDQPENEKLTPEKYASVVGQIVA